MKFISSLLDLFDPAQWLSWLIGGVIALALATGLIWWFNSKIRDHYQAPLIAEYKAAADSAERDRAKRELINNERKQEANNAQRKTLENIAANRKRIDAADDRLQNSLRPSATNDDELTACRQRADTLDSVQLAVREFAKRVVQECDRHIADKEALKAAWPE